MKLNFAKSIMALALGLSGSFCTYAVPVHAEGEEAPVESQPIVIDNPQAFINMFFLYPVEDTSGIDPLDLQMNYLYNDLGQYGDQVGMYYAKIALPQEDNFMSYVSSKEVYDTLAPELQEQINEVFLGYFGQDYLPLVDQAFALKAQAEEAARIAAEEEAKRLAEEEAAKKAQEEAENETPEQQPEKNQQPAQEETPAPEENSEPQPVPEENQQPEDAAQTPEEVPAEQAPEETPVPEEDAQQPAEEASEEQESPIFAFDFITPLTFPSNTPTGSVNGATGNFEGDLLPLNTLSNINELALAQQEETESKNQTASTKSATGFIDSYVSDNGKIYTSANSENYEQILSGENAYKALDTQEKKEVTTALTNAGSKPYLTLLGEASSIKNNGGKNTAGATGNYQEKSSSVNSITTSPVQKPNVRPSNPLGGVNSTVTPNGVNTATNNSFFLYGTSAVVSAGAVLVLIRKKKED